MLYLLVGLSTVHVDDTDMEHLCTPEDDAAYLAESVAVVENAPPEVTTG